MLQFKKNLILNIILLFSIFAIFSAFFIQYILGYQPCNLCLLERIPYYIAIIIIILKNSIKNYQNLFLILLAVTFVCATVLSFYHFGIEQGFFEESFVCNLNPIKNNLTADAILEQLKNSQVSCKNVTFKLMGLSLATINTIISIFLSAIILKLILNNAKNR